MINKIKHFFKKYGMLVKIFIIGIAAFVIRMIFPDKENVTRDDGMDKKEKRLEEKLKKEKDKLDKLKEDYEKADTKELDNDLEKQEEETKKKEKELEEIKKDKTQEVEDGEEALDYINDNSSDTD